MKLWSPETEVADLLARCQGEGPLPTRTYFPGGWTLDHPREVLALAALGPNPTVEQIVAVLYPVCIQDRECSDCKRPSRLLVELGETESYESQTAWICRECLERAVILAGGAPATIHAAPFPLTQV